jgi:hypothetical protein
MTEAEWLACDDPDAMLRQLRRIAGQRKLRLFGCACYRHVPALLVNECHRSAIEISERYADGAATKQELAHALNLARLWDLWRPAHPTPRRVSMARHRAALSAPDGYSERQFQADVLRDLFPTGPIPLRRRVPVAWLHKPLTLPRQVAKQIYDERAFEHLPILADALEDAGCTAAEFLDHLRSPGPHVRGCWALDLILGKR